MSTKPGDWWNESLNPIEGCTPISEACENCWALAMIKRFSPQQPQFESFPHRLDKVASWKKPRRIFVGSLTDMFHDKVLDQFFDTVDDVYTTADCYPEHTFVFLTKRPVNIWPFLFHSKRGAFSENTWIGITAENQQRLEERIYHIVDVPAGVKFLHMEPLLGPVDISAALPHVQWVCVGGENGPGARPIHPDWVRNIRDKCIDAGVKFWFKGWGSKSPVEYCDEEGTPKVVYFKPQKDGTSLFGESARLLDGREWNELPEVVNGH